MWPFTKTAVKGETAQLKISGLHCSSCVLNIDGALEDLDGVFSSKTNYARSISEIEYDPKRVTLTAIRQAIEDQGYTVS